MLEVSAIDTFYGETQALFGVSLSVGAGEVLALLGANGAGKTTVLRSILGLTRARRGDIRFEGRSILARPTHQIARAGIGWVPDDRRLCPTLTVARNLALGMKASRFRAWSLEEVTDLFTPLKYLMWREAETLSGGEMQMVAIARALLGGPGLMCSTSRARVSRRRSSTTWWASFAASRAPAPRPSSWSRTRKWHLASPTGSWCSRREQVAWSGEAQALNADPRSQATPARGLVMSAPLLALERVAKVYRRGLFDRTPAFRLDVDHTFEQPEIVGVMGPNGAGKTTLFEMIAGSNVPSEGRVIVAGQDIQRVRYRQRDRLAIHYHQSYQVRRFAKRLPAFLLEPAGGDYPRVHLFDEPQFNTQDGYIGFMLDFFRRLRAEGRLVFVCLHPTAAFQLEILREICERFLFVNRGSAQAFPEYGALTADADVRRYLGELAP